MYARPNITTQDQNLSEAAFYQAWVDRLDESPDQDPFTLSQVGGQLATDMAHVFSAGYQSALRKLFPQLKLSGWAALAISEDRSEVDALPGVVLTMTDGQLTLQGYKTWVAACDHLSTLIITAQDGKQSHLYHIARAAEGLSISRNPSPKILPNLSQGRAYFDQVTAAENAQLDPGVLKLFGVTEGLCILTAYLAAIEQVAPSPHQGTTKALDLTRIALQSPELPTKEALYGLKQAVQRISTAIQDTTLAPHHEWLKDPILVGLYARTTKR